MQAEDSIDFKIIRSIIDNANSEDTLAELYPLINKHLTHDDMIRIFEGPFKGIRPPFLTLETVRKFQIQQFHKKIPLYKFLSEDEYEKIGSIDTLKEIDSSIFKKLIQNKYYLNIGKFSKEVIDSLTVHDKIKILENSMGSTLLIKKVLPKIISNVL